MINVKDEVTKLTTGVHQAIFRASGGRLLGQFGSMPVVMLTTTGRKSGQHRTTMLTSPVHDGDKVVLVASYGGDTRHPAWFLNLQANPDVEVTMKGRTQSMQARVASPEERAELWPRAVRAYPGYNAYQRRTEREIPLVLLEPSPG